MEDCDTTAGEEFTMVIVNSLSDVGRMNSDVEVILQYLHRKYPWAEIFSSKLRIIEYSIPQQTDKINCGMTCVWLAKSLATGSLKFDKSMFSTLDFTTLRQELNTLVAAEKAAHSGSADNTDSKGKEKVEGEASPLVAQHHTPTSGQQSRKHTSSEHHRQSFPPNPTRKQHQPTTTSPPGSSQATTPNNNRILRARSDGKVSVQDRAAQIRETIRKSSMTAQKEKLNKRGYDRKKEKKKNEEKEEEQEEKEEEEEQEEKEKEEESEEEKEEEEESEEEKEEEEVETDDAEEEEEDKEEWVEWGGEEDEEEQDSEVDESEEDSEPKKKRHRKRKVTHPKSNKKSALAKRGKELLKRVHILQSCSLLCFANATLNEQVYSTCKAAEPKKKGRWCWGCTNSKKCCQDPKAVSLFFM